MQNNLYDAVYCKKCKLRYPSIFPMCPQCGRPAKKQKNPAQSAIRIVGIIAVIAAVSVLLFLVYNQSRRVEHYQLGKKLMAEGKYVEAQTAFGIAGDHEDAAQLLEEAKKGEHYQLGDAAYNRGDLETAIEEFTAAEDFNGAAFMVEYCQKGLHYEAGEAAYAAGDMDTAIAEFDAADDWPGADGKLKLSRQRKAYDEGVALMDRGDYTGALTKLQEAGNFTGTPERIAECYFALGKEAHGKGDYTGALEYLNKAGGSSDARQLKGECSLYVGKDQLAQGNYPKALEYLEAAKGTAEHLEPQLDNYILLCRAETAFATGNLNKGVEYFEKLPQDFKPAEFNVASRRSALSRIKNFAKLEGHFYSTQYTIQIIGEGYIYSYREGSADDQDITIDCSLNPDGSLNITGKAYFNYYASLPVYGYGFKSSHRVSFEINNVQWVPSVHVIDEHTKIYFSNGIAKIVYSNSVEGKYPTSSTVTYNEKK